MSQDGMALVCNDSREEEQTKGEANRDPGQKAAHAKSCRTNAASDEDVL